MQQSDVHNTTGTPQAENNIEGVGNYFHHNSRVLCIIILLWYVGTRLFRLI